MAASDSLSQSSQALPDLYPANSQLWAPAGVPGGVGKPGGLSCIWPGMQRADWALGDNPWTALHLFLQFSQPYLPNGCLLLALRTFPEKQVVGPHPQS